jgi:aspartate/glutamate racemase
MKKIGMLGGMSWTSSAEYYRLVNEEAEVDDPGFRCENDVAALPMLARVCAGSPWDSP